MYYPMFVERQVSYSRCKQRMTSFRGQASSAKMMSLGGKLIALACHPTKSVNKAEEPTYISINMYNPGEVLVGKTAF
jgi:hypothetical protein